MAGRQVETEALGQAANALAVYIKSVQGSIQKMKDAARDCSDNMGSDVYSKKAIERLESCTKELGKTMTEAEALRKKILITKRKIEDSGKSI